MGRVDDTLVGRRETEALISSNEARGGERKVADRLVGKLKKAMSSGK
jgi:hypothetical protein